MRRARTVVLIAGLLFFVLAVFVQGMLPALQPQSRYQKVTRVVRTDLGQLKWTMHRSQVYSDLEQLGREVYQREGCWYCHSQYVRPVAGEDRRWGPVSQSGEYAYDLPHFFSTRRIGPDLLRVGLKYSDEWHLAHFWDPRMLVPDSIMPSFRGLFDGPHGPVQVVTDDKGRKTLERTMEALELFDFEGGEPIRLTPNADGLLFVPERGRYPVIHTPNDEFTGDAVRLVAETRELRGLIAYLQRLGTNRGKWRSVFEPQRMQAADVSIPRSKAWTERGRKVYERRCEGCHGATGDGNGPAATFLHETRPRDFRLGLFKFRRTGSGKMPTDGDLLRTITRGVRGTAMPTWHMLPLKDRLAVIQYIKFELAVDRSFDPDNPWRWFVKEPAPEPMHIGEPPAPSWELVERGSELWTEAKCWRCHGRDGAGDGPNADELTDDFGFPIRPADLTDGLFKSGPSVQDVFRTISTGLNGTPMPSFGAQFSRDERWALAYYVLSLSAYTDPVNAIPLRMAESAKAALNDPGLEAGASDEAYVPEAFKREAAAGSTLFGGLAWARRHGIETGAGQEPDKE